jgi:polysaccharide biosynthesis transport protein
MSTTMEITPVTVQPEPQEPAAKLPFDVRTLVIGIRGRLHIVAAVACVSVLLGFAAAMLMGHKIYEASSVLLYKAPAGAGPESDGNEAPSLLTQMDMVKIPSNLEETRRRLKLKSSVEKLGTAVKVEVPINSSLMEITSTWDTAQGAADIANTVREVFLENQLRIQHAEAGNKIHDLETRLDKVLSELHTAEDNLKDFTVKNHVVDIDKEAGWYLQQLINTELVYEQAVGDERAARIQQNNMGQIVGDLKSKVRSEEDQVASDPASLTKNLSGDPAKDADIKGRVATLKEKEIEMQRSKTLAEAGIYSRSEYERARAAYETEKFALYNNSPSAALLREMTLRELNIKLSNISDQQKVAQLKEAVDRVRERLDALPLVQREYLALQREVAIRAAERERIDQFLSLARRQNESESFGFSLVAAAKPPALPLKSNKRLLFFALTILGAGLGVIVVLLMELADRRMYSVGDASAKLKTEVLAGFRHQKWASLGDGDDTALTLMSRLRSLGVSSGTRLMVVSPSAGEGAPEVAELLARTFANGGDSGLLIDAQFRELIMKSRPQLPAEGLRRKVEPAIAFLKPRILRPAFDDCEASLTSLADAGGVEGFSDLLAGESDDFTAPIRLSRHVRLLTAGTRPRPELLLSPRVKSVIRQCSLPTDLIFVNAAPMLPHPDATFLVPTVPNVLVVVSAGKTPANKVEQCIAKLREAGAAVLGVVVTNIADIYVEKKVA